MHTIQRFKHSEMKCLSFLFSASTDEVKPENVCLPPIKSQCTESVWSSPEVTYMAIRGDRVQNERGSTEKNGYINTEKDLRFKTKWDKWFGAASRHE